MTRKKYDIDDTMEGKWKECEFDGDVDFIIGKKEIQVEKNEEETDEIAEKDKKEDRIIEKVENVYFELYEYACKKEMEIMNELRMDKWMNMNERYLEFKIQ